MGPDRSHETTPAGIPWSEFGRLRGRFTDRWPTVFHLPLVHDHFALARQHAGPVRSLLDVGATERVHEPNARAAWPDIDYRSLDLDRTNRHDYHDFDEVDRQFDLLTLLEVLEQLDGPVAASALIARADDDDPRVRLAAVFALAGVPGEAADAAIGRAAASGDPHLVALARRISADRRAGGDRRRPTGGNR